MMTKLLGLRTVQDVASLYPPTLLSDKIKYLSKWRAVEMVMDARVSCTEPTIMTTTEFIMCSLFSLTRVCPLTDAY